MTPTSTSSGVFENLPLFSRAEVQLLNWTRETFGPQFNWHEYLRDSLSGLVWKRGSLNLSFTETSSADLSAGPKVHNFDKATVVLGRDPSSEIVLSSKIAARRHARVVVDRGQCFLEDLGSQLGTYLDGQKIPANQPHLIRSGSQVVIFPHTFAVTIRQDWVADDNVAFAAAPAQRASWKEFREGLPAGSIAYDVQVHPAAGSLRLAMDRRFVEALVSRVLREDNLTGTARSDRGLLEFMLLSVIRNASKRLRFPHQFCLAGAEALYPPSEPGLLLRFSLGLSGITGACQMFFPFSLMASMRKTLPAPPVAELPQNIPWLMAVEAANLKFRGFDLDGLEAGDVIQFDLDPALVVSTAAVETGWKLNIEADHPWRFRLDRALERSFFMDANANPGEGGFFNPASLPTRVQILLDEVQLTLSEISRLTEGGILELRAGKSDPVKILVNGVPYGAGELIEIEGKLGVRLTSWGKA